MKTTQCRYCDAPIAFITTTKQKATPVEPERIIRDGSEPPAPGKYFDDEGNCYDALNVPCKLPVYLSHWAKCPGRNQAREDAKGRHAAD